MTFRSLALTGILLASTLFLGAPKAQGSFNALLAIPTGDFADGDVMTGFGANLEGNARMSDVVGWVSGVSFIFNATDKDEAPSGVDVSGGNAFTIPALTGVRVTGTAQNNLKLYAQAQAGVTLFIISDLVVEQGGDEMTASTDPNIHLGFGGGIGLIFNDKVNVGVRFFSTPEMEMSGTVSSGGDSDDIKGDLTVSMMQLILGYQF